MWSILEFILILSQNIESVYGSTHARIGNYSELNAKDCGITRLSYGFSDKCFKWHKNPITAGMRDSKAAGIDEVPWIVQILIYPSWRHIPSPPGTCTGTIIADQWILTAAHCMILDNRLIRERLEDFELYFGQHSLQSPDKVYMLIPTEVHPYPGFEHRDDDFLPSLHDLVLIKVNQSIKSLKAIEGQKTSTELKSICLPEKDIFPTRDEHALSAGWGQIERNYTALQIGYKRLHPDTNPDKRFLFDLFGQPIELEINYTTLNYIKATTLDNQGLSCRGDSGSPLWQYHLGRAVLIGVLSFGLLSPTSCESHQNSSQWYVRVSNYIDWIQNVTQLK